MSWKIKNNQLVFDKNGKELFPSAREIYALLQEEENPELDSLDGSLGIRFSRIGGKYQLHLYVNDESESLQLEVVAKRGKAQCCVEYRESLPDNIVINGTWYNLLENYADTSEFLKNADIQSSGTVTLNQYLKLVRNKRHYENVEVIDDAMEYFHNQSFQLKKEKAPAALKATLYPYQEQGFRWMSFIADEQCGCILGDEMGLGKTLQIIALITARKQQGKGPSLVIAPVSLLENWKREFARFTEGIKLCVHHGSKRTGFYQDLLDYDVTVISYSTACSDQSLLRMIDWDLLVLDEAQNIKNPSATRTKAVKRIPRHTPIAVTGTPFENHMTDLWSLLDFIVPGAMGTLAEFNREIPDDAEGAEKMEPILTPLMIRRKVRDVAQDLPERIDIPQPLLLSTEETQAYEDVREQIMADFDGKNATLPMLQKLRMYCTHPQLIDECDNQDPTESSSKYIRLCELLDEIISLREKTILFTSYNHMFDILQKDIPQRFGIRVFTINGSTPVDERQTIIDEFSGIIGPALLVLNPRAAGTGLNITAASRVIHYNLEWNPALEDQASARAYRRGQKKTVFVYRLFYKDTVEEVINERIEKKRTMFGTAVIGTDGSANNSEDIMRALMISPGGNRYEY